MAPPSISICILNYNYGRYLARAIDSALGQQPGDYRLEEVLVIDDGSTDESMVVCERYGSKITVLRRPHEGFGAVLTAAVHTARGQWIAPLDADDSFTADKLAAVAPALTDAHFLLQHWEHVVGGHEQPLLAKPHPGGNTSTLLVRRQPALDLLPVNNEAFFHVFDYLGYGARITEPLTYYRVHDANMTDRANPGVFQDYLRSVNLEIANRLRELGGDPPRWADGGTLKRLSWHFTALAWGNVREAAVQRGRRGTALAALTCEICVALLARRAAHTHWVGAKSAALMRPTVVVGRPPQRIEPVGG
ncbi:MAG: glycosyltransferase family 2 protein [Streptomyces sp.]|nr:glycosyltransferase family 2 protein [Streptomyces sp.]